MATVANVHRNPEGSAGSAPNSSPAAVHTGGACFIVAPWRATLNAAATTYPPQPKGFMLPEWHADMAAALWEEVMKKRGFGHCGR